MSVKMGGGKEHASGLRLIASDAPVDSGTGPQVRGSAVALLLAVSGRPLETGEITGPGTPTLTQRTTAG
ncbi:hypothetical protein [Dactylosporangium sp. NPDC005555]|uniref:hypothetical protein n=1 Tax=Dactylosporangium sp. NPDC005555 TaxID=3154889 RepID=UPI0033BF5102